MQNTEYFTRVFPYGGEELAVHSRDGQIFYVHANYSKISRTLDTTVEIDEEQLLGRVLTDLGKFPYDLYKLPSFEKIVYKFRRRHTVAYKVDVLLTDLNRWLYFIDAGSGRIINKMNNTQPILISGSGTDLLGAERAFNVWQDNGQFYLIDPTIPVTDHVADPLASISGSYVFDLLNSENFTFSHYSTASVADSAWDEVGDKSDHFTQIRGW